MPSPRSSSPNVAPAIEAFSRSFASAQAREEANAKQMDLHVIEAAKTNPALLNDPRVAKAAESVYGKDAAPIVLEAFKASTDPEHASYNMLSNLGLLQPGEQVTPPPATPTPPAPDTGFFAGLVRGAKGEKKPEPKAAPAEPSPYAGSTQKLVERVPQIAGGTVKLGPKGAAVEVKGKTQKESDEATFYKAVGARAQDLIAKNPGMDEGHAMFQATREAASVADQNRVLVPKSARDLANADTEFLIKQRLERMKKDVELEFAGRLAYQRGKGGIQAKEDSPISARDLPLVMDPESGKPVPPDTTYSEARRNGAAFMDPKDVEAIHASGIGWDYAEQLHEIGQRLFTSDNAVEAAAHGAVLWGQAKTGANPDAVALATLNKNWLLFVRNSLNEKGNIAARLVEKSGTTFGFVNTSRGFAAKERVMAGLIAASKKARGGVLSKQEQQYIDEVQHNIDVARGEDLKVSAAKTPTPGPGMAAPAAGSQPPASQQPSSPPAPAAGAPPPAAPAAAAPPSWQDILKRYPEK